MLPQKIEFQVSQEHIKSILGVRGSTLLELQGDTGCRISFVDGSKVRISGDLDENVQSAVMRIRQIIRECDRKQQTQNATEWGARGSEHEKLRTSDRMPSTDLLEGSCHVHQLPALADTQRSVYMEEVRYSSHQMPGSQRGEVMEESFYPQQFRALPDTQHSECREHSHCSLNPQVPENTIRSDYLYGSYNLQYVQALNDTQRSVLLEESHCLPHQAIGSSNIKMDDSYNAPSLQVPVSTARTEPLEDSYFPQQFRTFTDIQRFRRLDDSHCASSLDAQANTIKSERLDESCYPRHLQALIGMQQAKSSLLPHSAGTQKGEHMDESSCSPQQLSDSQKEEALDESCYPRHLPALADTQRSVAPCENSCLSEAGSGSRVVDERLDESCYPRHLPALADTQRSVAPCENSCLSEAGSGSRMVDERLDESCYPRHLPALADTQHCVSLGNSLHSPQEPSASRDAKGEVPVELRSQEEQADETTNSASSFEYSDEEELELCSYSNGSGSGDEDAKLGVEADKQGMKNAFPRMEALEMKSSGSKEDVSRLREEVKEAEVQVKASNNAAAQAIGRSNNEGRGVSDDYLDMTNLLVPEALEMLKERIKRLRDRPVNTVSELQLVTCPSNSVTPGGLKLINSVKAFLTKENIKFNEISSTAVLALVNGTRVALKEGKQSQKCCATM
ncbi:hypothetical protein, conserved [Trypanosoma vivax Y486]|uniref:K Homology domain-containing protein n=1 Tax=Trypanosoma vivax (strain Y486) TaxID=1055687 RepID=F9WS44_TRYVY|nr:conserved hypothetical protein [Trypanosoma vivax Y486]CCD20382.1 hypothetical protein, conserved [Trypanosoma vivax Y486]|eukprot:CCD20382.1 hypothetical protein, conserved [Trypanosoma vivax Y486]